MIKSENNIIKVSSLKVSCDGENNNSSEGHPLIWLQIDEEVGYIFCPYCEQKFVFEHKYT